MILHIVLLKLKPTLSADQLGSFGRALADTLRQIPSVDAAQVGPRTAIDAGYPRDFGDTTYDFAAVLSFRDRDGLQEYLRHPLHADIGRQFWEICEKATIFETDALDLRTSEPAEYWLANLRQPRP